MNKARCRNCKDVLHSKHRHDFQQCSCRTKSDELAAEFMAKIEHELPSDRAHFIACMFEEVVGRGIFIDGGDDYQRVGGNLEDVEILTSPEAS